MGRAAARAAQEAKDAAEGTTRKVSYKEKRALAVAAAAGPTLPKRSEDEEKFTDANDAMRKLLMELQGMKHGKPTGDEQSERKELNQLHAREIEDDYLFE